MRSSLTEPLAIIVAVRFDRGEDSVFAHDAALSQSCQGGTIGIGFNFYLAVFDNIELVGFVASKANCRSVRKVAMFK